MFKDCSRPTEFGRTTMSSSVVIIGRGFLVKKRVEGLLEFVGLGEPLLQPVCVFSFVFSLTHLYVYNSFYCLYSSFGSSVVDLGVERAYF